MSLATSRVILSVSAREAYKHTKTQLTVQQNLMSRHSWSIHEVENIGLKILIFVPIWKLDLTADLTVSCILPFQQAALFQPGPPPPAESPWLLSAGEQIQGNVCRNIHPALECTCCNWSASWQKGSVSSEPASCPTPRTPEHRRKKIDRHKGKIDKDALKHVHTGH